LSFGLLMIPSLLAGWIMGMSDRYFLSFYGELSDVGIYSLGYKFGKLLEILIVWPFQLAWPAFSFSISADSNHTQMYARTLTYLLGVLIFALLGLSLMGRPLLQLIVHHDYVEAYKIIPLIALSYVFSGIHYCVSPGIHLSGNTRYLPVVTFSACLINILLNIIFIPHFGMIGAAWATVVSFGILGIATFLLSTIVYPIAYEYARITKLCVSGLLLYCINVVFRDSSIVCLVVSNIILILAFPILLVVFGFFDVGEKKLCFQKLCAFKKAVGLSAL